MKVADAIEGVLLEAGRPLSRAELEEQLLARGFCWSSNTVGKTLKRAGSAEALDQNRFVRSSAGYCANPHYRRPPRDEPIAGLARLLTRAVSSPSRPLSEPDLHEAGVPPAKQARLAKAFRIVNDWIGRMPARLDPRVLHECIAAILNEQAITVKGRTRRIEMIRDAPAFCCVLSPYGLVVKDGTLYLIGAVSDGRGEYHLSPPIALHRVSSVAVSQQRYADIGFDLDAAIRASNNFSSPVPEWSAEPFALELLVEAQSIYHFIERPIATDQDISNNRERISGKDWYRVTATMPATVLLVPFLLSMGPWIRVVGPERLLEEMAWRTRGMADHYADVTLPPGFRSVFDEAHRMREPPDSERDRSVTLHGSRQGDSDAAHFRATGEQA
ncbi:MAG: hypothetical protein RL722_261 [Pseudomonadota bacterium]